MFPFGCNLNNNFKVFMRFLLLCPMQSQNLEQYCREGLSLGDTLDSTHTIVLYYAHLHLHTSPDHQFPHHTVSSMIMIILTMHNLQRTNGDSKKVYLDRALSRCTCMYHKTEKVIELFISTTNYCSFLTTGSVVNSSS